MDDLNNKVVARWLQVDIRSDVKSDSGIQNHQVLLEDRQPNSDPTPLTSGAFKSDIAKLALAAVRFLAQFIQKGRFLAVSFFFFCRVDRFLGYFVDL